MNWLRWVGLCGVILLFLNKLGRMSVMQRTSQLIIWPVLMLLLVASGGCSREEPDPVPAEIPGVEIPLDTIWGWGMPGTQDVKTLESDHLQANSSNSLSYQISQAIHRQSRKNWKALPIGPGFAVAGSGHEALVAVKEAMDRDQIPPQTFPADTEISLFFFAREGLTHFGLKDVRQSSETVTIWYQIQLEMGPHHEVIIAESLSRHFALIPLKKPAAGNYTVDVVPAPVEEVEEKYRKYYRLVDKESLKKHICKSFEFVIEPSGKESTGGQGRPGDRHPKINKTR